MKCVCCMYKRDYQRIVSAHLRKIENCSIYGNFWLTTLTTLAGQHIDSLTQCLGPMATGIWAELAPQAYGNVLWFFFL